MVMEVGKQWESLESETGHWKVEVNKHHPCCYCFFPIFLLSVGAFLGWDFLR